ncbi:MAG: nuclear transport factor 2 family protein [Coriobacteriia bacterium]|nr:nuclear transport factor 2 family protein [Coriobacteriia bacterium]
MAKESAVVKVDFKKLTEHILDSYLNSDPEANADVLNLLDESISVIGTGKQEFFRNLQEFSQAFVFDVGQREKIRFTWSDFALEEQKLDEEHMLVYGSVLILGTFPDGNTSIKMDSRFTILYGVVDGVWKVLHIHHSVPDKDQLQGEEFPKTLGRQVDAMYEIIAASNMGTWNIYLLDGKAPRMEADDLMLGLLGVADKNLTPEEVYDAWFANIVPDSLPSVLRSVEKMKEEGRDENTYLWRHPVLGERYVRCGGTGKPVEGGFCFVGIITTLMRWCASKSRRTRHWRSRSR